MVLIRVNDEINRILRSALEHTAVPGAREALLEPSDPSLSVQASDGTPAVAKFVSHAVLAAAVRASTTAQSSSDAPGSLRGLIQRSPQVWLSAVERENAHSRASRSEALEARLAKLRRAQEEREYAAMVRDVAGGTTYAGTDGDTTASDYMYAFRNQMSIGANVVATMGTCFALGYFLGYATWNKQEMALVGGLAGLIVALMVDVGIIVARVYAIDKEEARKRRANDSRTGKSHL